MQYNVKSPITNNGFSTTQAFNYEQEALRTLSGGFHIDNVTPNVLHGAIGIATEAGEILDAVKKSVFYGKEFDIVNLQEEIGDCFWYLAVLAVETGVSFDIIMKQNISKLAKRYPDKFTKEHALVRDIKGEREVLESFSN